MRIATRFISVAALAFLAALPLAGCSKKKPAGPSAVQALSPEQEERAAEVLAGVTAGVLGVREPVVVEFLFPQAATDEVGLALEKSPFRFEPALEGTARWRDPKTLVFEPKEPMARGRTYAVALDLPGLLGDKELPVYPFSFSVQRQRYSWTPERVQTLADRSVTISGSVELLDPSEAVDLAKFLAVEQDGAKPKQSWKRGAEAGKYTLEVAGLRRDEDDPVLLKFSGEAVGSDLDRVDTLRLPDADELGVVAVLPFQGERERGFRVLFSDPLADPSDLRGLVETRPGDNEPTLSVEGERLTIGGGFPTDRSMQLIFAKGLPARGAARLPERFVFRHRFGDFQPRVRFPVQGAILPTAVQDRLPFETMNLGTVEISVSRVSEANLPFFLAEGNLKQAQRNMYPVGREVLRRTLRTGAQRNEWFRGGLDLRPVLKAHGPGLYHVELKRKREGMLYDCPAEKPQRSSDDEGEEGGDYEDVPSPCREWYWNDTWSGTARINVLVSDLGLVANSDPDGGVSVAAVDLLKAAPWKGAKVELLDAQGQVLSKDETDGDGFAAFERAPRAFLVRAAAENGSRHLAFLRLDGDGLSLSRFDAGGEASTRGTKLFLYSERGVYRPGDSIYVGCIVRGQNGDLLDRLPIKLSLRDPEGRTLQSVVLKAAPDGHFGWRTATRADDRTGRWSLVAEAGPDQRTLPILVETVRPNRLKVELDIEGDMITSDNLERTVRLRSRWLAGGSASGLRAKIDVTLSPASTGFTRFSEYAFDDPTRTDWTPEPTTLLDGELDGNGEASAQLALGNLSEAPGMVAASIRSRVFEPGGQASLEHRAVRVSPFSHYAGVRITGMNSWGSAEVGKPVTIEAIAVSEEGKESKGRALEIEVYHNPYWWWWDYDNSEVSFLSRSDTRKVATFEAKSGKGVSFEPEESGQYMALVRDRVSGHRAGTEFHVWSWGSGEEGGSGGAAQLAVEAERDTVEIGRKIEVRFPSPGQGRALVQLMRGRRILAQEWIELDGKSGKWSTKATAEMVPGVYVQVLLLQPYGAGNDRPLRMFGLAPVQVVDPETRLDVRLETPARMEPEKTATVRIREGGKRPMRVVLAVVDEGLLDLTNFKTPNPWKSFHAKEALAVRSWDLFDQVIGSYSGKLDQMFSVGGDAELKRGEREANGKRFPPMVRFFGPFEVPKGGAEVPVPVPLYTGSVRVMAIATAGRAYGAAEKAVPVRSPVMVLATAPRAISPGDRIRVPVSVFSEKAGTVAVSIALKGPIQGAGPLRQDVVFDEAGQKEAYFEIEAQGRVAPAEIAVTAQAPHGKGRQVQPLLVRLPEAPRTVTEYGMTGPGGWKATLAPFGIAGTRTARLELSRSGLLGLERRLDDLIGFPHGCLEQTVSKAFPQLVLDRLVVLKPDEARRVESYVRAAIDKLPTFQAPGGGLSLWPGEDVPYEWGSLWAGRFLVLAKRKGYAVPASLIDPLLAHLREASRKWSPGVYATLDDTLSQVARLDLLALAGQPDLGSMNRLRSAPLQDVPRWSLAAAYASAGRKDAVQALLKGIGTRVATQRTHWGSLSSPLRDRALILEAMVRTGQKALAARQYADLRRDFYAENVWLSTQEAGTLFWAFSEAMGPAIAPDDFQAEWRVGSGAWRPVQAQKGLAKIDLPGDAAGSIEVRSKSGSVGVLLTMRGVPAPGEMPPPESQGLALDVEYKDEDGNRLDPSSLRQGTDFFEVIRVTNESSRELRNLALVNLLAGGWEIRNERLEGEAQEGKTVSSEVDRLEIRDDRTLHYFSLRPNETKTFVVGLNAAYAGSYHRPGVHVTAMYDAWYSAWSPGGKAEVGADE